MYAIKDGIDNDGDGLIDEGIDESIENNRRIVNELGAYYQINWKLTDKFELVQATRWDVHDRLTDMVQFNNEEGRKANALNWEFNFDDNEGLQVSPKVGLIYRPKENQTFRFKNFFYYKLNYCFKIFFNVIFSSCRISPNNFSIFKGNATRPSVFDFLQIFNLY